MKRTSVAVRLAAMSTVSSATRPGWAALACNAASAAEVSARPMPNAIRPRT